MSFVLAVDAGTSSSRAIVYDDSAQPHSLGQISFNCSYQRPGWVEQDPTEVWETQREAIDESLRQRGVSLSEIAAIGITNQRETTVVWDRNTGMPVYNAIVWQDRRTADFCEELRERGLGEVIQRRTGLVIDPYFSATKVRWILENVTGARERAARGELAFGTIDSWLIWNMTGGEVHVTDISNASRTMLMNLRTGEWDHELLEIFGIPESMLPRVVSSSEVVGYYRGMPIAGIAGDQQAALFGQACLEPGMVKTTYGTGAFILMNIGGDVLYPRRERFLHVPVLYRRVPICDCQRASRRMGAGDRRDRRRADQPALLSRGTQFGARI